MPRLGLPAFVAAGHPGYDYCQEVSMTDLIFLPWRETCQGHVYGGAGYRAVPISQEFAPYAAAFSNWTSCDDCDKDWHDLEIGISPACSLEGVSFLDRLHDAEDIVHIRLSRGFEPWTVEIHHEVYHYPTNVWLPWLQFHFFGPFDWGEDTERLSRLANTVIPYLCTNALFLSAYA
jgi:hypothetical protein